MGNIHKTWKLEPKAPQVQISKPKVGGRFGEMETDTKIVESIQGCSATTPDPKGDQMIQGCIWPLGKLTFSLPSLFDLPCVDANEFVVYETKRVIPKILIKVESISCCDSDDDDEDLSDAKGLNEDGFYDDFLDDDF